LNKWVGREDAGLATSSLAHYSMLPTSGYGTIGDITYLHFYRSPQIYSNF